MKGSPHDSSTGTVGAKIVPLCRFCHRPLALKSIEPDAKYSNLDVHLYQCDCGYKLETRVSRHF
jgi:hypothetical protein